MRDAADREVTGILTKEQLARLKPIQLWLDRDAALFNAEVIAELKLVSVQTDGLTAIWKKYQHKVQDKVSELRASEGTRDENRRKLEELRATWRTEASEEYFGVLTEEQREQFDKMCGPKFDVDKSEFREQRE